MQSPLRVALCTTADLHVPDGWSNPTDLIRETLLALAVCPVVLSPGPLAE